MVIHPLIGRSFVWSYRIVHLAPLALIFWPFPMTWLAVILAAFWPVWTMLVWLFESAVLGQRFGLTVTQKARDTMRAADMGDADAQYRLAGYFDRGEEGLQAADRMCDQAERWYGKAATQGHRAAQFDLAELLMGVLSGEPFLPDETPALPKGSIYHEQRQARINGGMAARRRAAHWYRKAAEQGHVTAQGRLGEMYRTGNGVTRNVAAARRWLSRALAATEAAQAKADETEDVLISAERKADIRAWKAGLDQLQGVMSGEGDAASKG
jgi:hypothetical protein